VLVGRAEDEVLIGARPAAAEAHPVLGQRPAADGEGLEVGHADVHSQHLRVRLADAERRLARIAGPLDRVAAARLVQLIVVEREEARRQRIALRRVGAAIVSFQRSRSSSPSSSACPGVS